MSRIVATLAAPTGLLTALEARANAQGVGRAGLLAKAGLTQTDWDNLSTALSSASAANFLKLLNASRVVLAMQVNGQQVIDDASGIAQAISFNSQTTSLHGDLT